MTAGDPHLCPRCQVRGPVPLLAGTSCPSCQAIQAWERYEGEKLVISAEDIAAAVARRRDERPKLGARILPFLPLVVGTVLATGAGLAAVHLFGRRGPGPLADIIADVRQSAIAATLLGFLAVAGAALVLWRSRARRRHRGLVLLTGHALVVAAALVAGAAGVTVWYGIGRGTDFRYLVMPPRAAATLGTDTVERIQAATALIVAGDEHGDFSTPAIGAGAVIAAEAGRAWIVTCSHVAMPYVSPASWRDPATASPLWVELADGRSTIGKVRWTARPPLDVALVEVAVADPPRPVAIADGSERAIASTDVLFVPNPLRLGWLVHRGAVVKRERHDTPAGEYSLLYTDLPVQPGDSGSGLFDGAGALVGLNTWAGSDRGAPLGISLPAEVMPAVVEFIEKEGRQ